MKILSVIAYILCLIIALCVFIFINDPSTASFFMTLGIWNYLILKFDDSKKE